MVSTTGSAIFLCERIGGLCSACGSHDITRECDFAWDRSGAVTECKALLCESCAVAVIVPETDDLHGDVLDACPWCAKAWADSNLRLDARPTRLVEIAPDSDTMRWALRCVDEMEVKP